MYLNIATIILIVLWNLPAKQANGQQLFTGDSVPDLIIYNVINHPEGKVQLSDYKDKLLILDFFGSFCAPCIEHLSDYMVLREKMQDLTILPIAAEGPERVGKIMSKKGWNGPYAVKRDSIVYNYFPYTIIPHLVWIKNMHIVSITGAEALTEQNIRTVLNGNMLVNMEKNDQISYDMDKPLLINGNGGDGKSLKFQSIITGYIPGIPGGYGRPKNGLKSINTSALELYKRIFSDGAPENYFFQFDNRISLIMSDSLKAILRNGSSFCYSLLIPRDVSRDQIMQFAKTDLNRFFGLYYGIIGSIEIQEVNCLELIKSDTKPSSRSSSFEGTQVTTKDEFIRIENMQMLLQILANKLKNLNIPIIAGVQENNEGMDMEFPKDLVDLSGIRSWLKGYGLDLKENKHEVKMLVVRDIDRKIKRSFKETHTEKSE